MILKHSRDTIFLQFLGNGHQCRFFHEFRLGTALDALYGKTGELYSEIVFRGLAAFKIAIKRLHLGTTTISLHGDYDTIQEVLPSLIKPPPRPDYGKSKDHREDLKQLVLSLTVGDFGGPICGRMVDGNTSDVVEFRHHLNSLAGMLEDLRELVLVAENRPPAGKGALSSFRASDDFHIPSRIIRSGSSEELQQRPN